MKESRAWKYHSIKITERILATIAEVYNIDEEETFQVKAQTYKKGIPMINQHQKEKSGV